MRTTLVFHSLPETQCTHDRTLALVSWMVLFSFSVTFLASLSLFTDFHISVDDCLTLFLRD